MTSYGRPVWAEINLSALNRNVENIKSLLKPDTKFCAVVKADAYGHGAIAVAREAVKAGAEYLAVAIVDEAMRLRRAGFTQNILVMGYTPNEQGHLLARHDITQTVFSLNQAQAFSKAAIEAGRTIKVHLKVDSGMGRLGVPFGQAAELAEEIMNLPGLFLEGIFSHFASADSPDTSFADKQFDLFQQCLDNIGSKSLSIPIRHCANSAAALQMPHTHLDMVRIGIIMYGLWPYADVEHSIDLYPVMTLKARVAMVKQVSSGTPLSYGSTFVTTKESTIVTLPIGYADGWSRRFSNNGEVCINGRRASVVGRICMDQCLVDATGIDGLKQGDEVVLFGAELGADELARRLQSINYEIVCMIGQRVPRIYI